MKNKFEIAAVLLTVSAFGLGLGYAFPKKQKTKKEYPVQVTREWVLSNGYNHCITEGDSLKVDTLFKDGNKLKLKNLVTANLNDLV